MATSKQPNNPTARVLPDRACCRAVPLTPSFSKCLVEKPATCPYVIPWGYYTFLCGHPDREAIVADTKQLREQNQQSMLGVTQE
jgi:hypothetical protein